MNSRLDYSLLAVVCCQSDCIIGSVLSSIVGSFVPWKATMPRNPDDRDTPGNC